MTLEDFMRCTPTEIDAIFNAYRQKAEDEYKDRWEMMRKAVTISIQPHVKKKVNEKQVLTFPWDNKLIRSSSRDSRKLTKEEKHERFEHLKEILKDNKNG
ncbi:MAG: hypothetical protein LKE41_00995 [Prevotella sp.]|jgi:hypothetical protein|nr:hypothetical protein [Prevotella sp.]